MATRPALGRGLVPGRAWRVCCFLQPLPARGLWFRVMRRRLGKCIGVLLCAVLSWLMSLEGWACTACAEELVVSVHVACILLTLQPWPAAAAKPFSNDFFEAVCKPLVDVRMAGAFMVPGLKETTPGLSTFFDRVDTDGEASCSSSASIREKSYGSAFKLFPVLGDAEISLRTIGDSPEDRLR